MVDFPALAHSSHDPQPHKNYLMSSEQPYEVARIHYDLQDYEAAARTAMQALEYYRQVKAWLQSRLQDQDQLIAELQAYNATVAHDLKDPLSVIIAYADLLSLSDQPDLALVVEIANTAHGMAELIDNLLLLTRIDRLDVTFQDVDLGEVVDYVLHRLAPVIAEAQCQVDMPTEWPRVMGYTAWIEVILNNYLLNAMKYGGKPPRVEIGCECGGSGLVRVWVKDNGDGIPPDQQHLLFKEFSRLPQTASAASGNGLGLAIVRRMVEKLGGSVAVESRGLPGEGAVFSFTLICASV